MEVEGTTIVIVSSPVDVRDRYDVCVEKAAGPRVVSVIVLAVNGYLEVQ